MPTFFSPLKPNARGEPRQEPQRGTSEGCWRRLQCDVRSRAPQTSAWGPPSARPHPHRHGPPARAGLLAPRWPLGAPACRHFHPPVMPPDLQARALPTAHPPQARALCHAPTWTPWPPSPATPWAVDRRQGTARRPHTGRRPTRAPGQTGGGRHPSTPRERCPASTRAGGGARGVTTPPRARMPGGSDAETRPWPTPRAPGSQRTTQGGSAAVWGGGRPRWRLVAVGDARRARCDDRALPRRPRWKSVV